MVYTLLRVTSGDTASDGSPFMGLNVTTALGDENLIPPKIYAYIFFFFFTLTFIVWLGGNLCGVTSAPCESQIPCKPWHLMLLTLVGDPCPGSIISLGIDND